MQIIRCRICGSSSSVGADRRCRGCRLAKAATDAGTSYGRFAAQLYADFGELEELPPDLVRTCPMCKRLFRPGRKNQIYDCTACAQRAAAKNYYRRKKRDACHRAPVVAQGGNIDGANTSD